MDKRLQDDLVRCLGALHTSHIEVREELINAFHRAASALDAFLSHSSTTYFPPLFAHHPPPHSPRRPQPSRDLLALGRLEGIQKQLLQIEPHRVAGQDRGEEDDDENVGDGIEIDDQDQQLKTRRMSAMKHIWSEFDGVTRLTYALLLPVLLYYGWCTIKGQRPNELLTFALDTYSQSVGIYAVQIMHSQFRKHLGVTRTLTHIFQVPFPPFPSLCLSL